LTPFGIRLRALREGIIWDDAEALQEIAGLSHPRVVVDTGGLAPEATELANRLARQIADLPEETVEDLLARLKYSRSAE
jgi:hypothetical protein